jgi:hypothetical protein
VRRPGSSSPSRLPRASCSPHAPIWQRSPFPPGPPGDETSPGAQRLAIRRWATPGGAGSRDSRSTTFR